MGGQYVTRHDQTIDDLADAGAGAPASRETKPATAPRETRPANRPRQRETTSAATRAEAAELAPKPTVSQMLEQRMRAKARREGADVTDDVITRARDDYRRRVSASVLATLEANNPLGFAAVRARRMRVGQSMLDGMTPSAIAQREGVSRPTVYNDWRIFLAEHTRPD